MIWPVLDTASQQGLLYAIAVFGIVVSFRLMNFPDLTVDGSFALGGAVVAVLLTNGLPPIPATLLAALSGAVAGGATVFLNRKLGISKILSGILVMLMLYSVNLRIMGRANISLLRTNTLFSFADGRSDADLVRISLFLGICAITFLLLCYFVTTRLGLFIRATGDNELVVQSQGVNTNWLYLIGIGLANMLIALSGGLVAQFQGFADANMGAGMIITTLAALIIGEGVASILAGPIRALIRLAEQRRVRPAPALRLLPWGVFGELLAAMLGAFLYFLIIATCLRLGLAPTDLRLATGVLVIVGISLRLRGPTIETYIRSPL